MRTEDPPIRALAQPEINYIESETGQQSIVKLILPPFGKERRSAAKLLTKDEARRIANNFAMVAGLAEVAALLALTNNQSKFYWNLIVSGNNL